VASLFIHTLKDEKEQDKEYIKNSKKKWRELLAPTLTKWLGDGPYFLGDTMSAIEFLVCKPLNNINSMGMLDESPELARLFKSVSSRPSFNIAYGVGAKQGAEQPRSRTLSLVPTG